MTKDSFLIVSDKYLSVIEWIWYRGISPLQYVQFYLEPFMLAGCLYFSEAPDPSGTVFDLGMCTPALE